MDSLAGLVLEGLRIFDEKYYNFFLHNTTYNAVKYPFIAFNYRMPKTTNLTMMFKCEGHFKDLAFSPSEPTVKAYKDGYSHIGDHWGMTAGIFSRVEGIVADGKWHFVKLNVLDQLKALQKNGKYLIEKVALREQNRSNNYDWMQVDNFTIYSGKSRKFKVRWEPPLQEPSNTFSYRWYLVDSDNRKVSQVMHTTDTAAAFEKPASSGKFWFVVEVEDTLPSLVRQWAIP